MAVLTAGVSAAEPGRTSTPPLAWSGAARVGVQCLVTHSPTVDADVLQARLCDRVRAVAAERAPVPVEVVRIGDPKLIERGTVALLVHGAVQPAGRGGREPLLVFSVRTLRASGEQTTVLFGAPPRAAPLAASGDLSPQTDAALRATLTETLPWLSQGR